jgi:hypothetical protein
MLILIKLNNLVIHLIIITISQVRKYPPQEVLVNILENLFHLFS